MTQEVHKAVISAAQAIDPTRVFAATLGHGEKGFPLCLGIATKDPLKCLIGLAGNAISALSQSEAQQGIQVIVEAVVETLSNPQKVDITSTETILYFPHIPYTEPG